MNERNLKARIDIGPRISEEPTSCILLYSAGPEKGLSLVATSRENGDAEVFMTSSEAKRVAEAILQAIKEESR